MPTTHRDGGELVRFDSRLERDHFVFLTALGQRVRREESASFFTGTQGYCPDFRWMSRGRWVWLEIKPRFPTDEEIRRCEALARQGHAVALLYGDVKAPFSRQVGRSSYAHANGTRAMFWEDDGEFRGADLAWGYAPARGLYLYRRASTADDAWCHPKLVDAYRAVVEG